MGQVLVEGKSALMPCGRPHSSVSEDMQWHREVWMSLPFITCNCGHVTSFRPRVCQEGRKESQHGGCGRYGRERRP